MTGGAIDLTIVVPACNVGRYIASCLDSILAQSAWPRCQVIVVDDGSTDDTASIVADHAAAHPRIRLVRQANGGPGAGAARNNGFDLVDTVYVLFLDGDDELAPEGVGLLLRALDESGLDLAVGATEQFPTPREWLWSQYFRPGEVRAVRIEDVPLLAYDSRTCDKLYRTEPLRASGLRFAEGVNAQDIVVNVPAMLQATELVLVGDVVYRYRRRDDGSSVMDSQFTRHRNYWDHLRVTEQLASMRSEVPTARRSFIDAFIARTFQEYSWRAPQTLPAGELPEFFNRAGRLIRDLDPQMIMQATRDAWERAAYVTMIEGDYDTYRQLDRHTGRLRADDGHLYLDLPTSTPETLAMSRTGGTRAWADRLTVDSAEVSFRLRLRVRGARNLDTALEGIMIRGIQARQTSFERRITVRPDDANGREHTALVRIPLSDLAPGEHLMRVGFKTQSGQPERWIRRPDGADAAPDEAVLTGQASLSLSGRGDRAVLTFSRRRRVFHRR